MHESERVEFKSRFVDDIYKEVIAFANTNGGSIYIGLNDDGEAAGLTHDEIDNAYTRITNGIRDAILPDVTMFVKYELQENVLRIDVEEGSFKPYYLKGKGMKPTGVFVRQGTSSVPASSEAIRHMIKVSDGDVFEEMRAAEQELTFQEAERAFEKYHVTFTEEKYTALGFRKPGTEQFTNLAWMMSDQCSHTTKIAVFGDEDNITFKDSKEFGGSLLRQLDEAFSYLTLCNRTASEFKGLERIEKADYPEAALREALLNALVHRDYGYSGSIIVNVNDAKMEFISLGGLVQGLTAEDIKSGVSQPRNRMLAEVFHRLRLIESYGTGIRKIYALYKDCKLQPEIAVTPNTFKLILPNMNAAGVSSLKQAETVKYMEESPTEITPQMKKVLDYLEEHGEMTNADLQELLGIKRTRSYTLARRMCEENLISSYGRGESKVFRAKEMK